jgi:HTH-type transcriptional regulator/antitoxin HigA
MKPKVIKTEEEHQIALSKVESLMDAEPGTAKEAELELWSLLVENYEREHHAIDLPDPVEAIRFRMEQRGMRAVDMVPYFSSKSRVSEVLGRKRPLTLSMIRALSAGLHIPAEVLIREPRKKSATDLRRKRAKALVA